MSDDPYADLPSVTAVEKKRGRNEDEELALPPPKRAEPAPEATMKPTPKATMKPALDVFETIAKIKGYMLVDKKFSKASVLFGKLLVDQCSVESPDEKVMTSILDALKEVMTAKMERVNHADARHDFKSLFDLVQTHRAALLTAPEYEDDTLDNWVLTSVLHNELFTDDSFGFAKAAKAISTHLDRRSHGVENANELDVAGLDKALFPCLRTLMTRHSTSWAKTSVELVMNRLTATRMSFPEELRAEIDSWTQQIHQRKHTPLDKVSAAAEFRKNIIIYNDTQTGNKVGRVNHPLLNKN
ncbi:hypothetical protein ACHHYP_11884 [Achlya hypogyna]|uniref:Uncharacterized protein n=1 Tax=Achlya hypogyna TaxID=1202772 RepID=A0A1V9YI91_ACHHY|nr:hypothetical protein ACHHYP_11884 [Achlya hypogyna]